jgi:hypothetical protein
MTEIKPTDLNSLPLVMVRDSLSDEWCGPRRLIVVIAEAKYPCIVVNERGTEVSVWASYKPYHPPTKRPMTDAEIFRAIREGAVIRETGLDNAATNTWDALACDAEEHQICRNYTGTDSDIWEPLEVVEQEAET